MTQFHKKHQISITAWQDLEEDGPWMIAHTSFLPPYEQKILYTEHVYESPESAIRALVLIFDAMVSQTDDQCNEITVEWFIMTRDQVDALFISTDQ